MVQLEVETECHLSKLNLIHLRLNHPHSSLYVQDPNLTSEEIPI